MKINKLNIIKLKYIAEALNGNSQEMAMAIINQSPLLHPSARALINYARIYISETDFDAIAAALPLKPILSRIAFLGWAFIRHVDSLIDNNNNLKQKRLIIHKYYQILRKDNSNVIKNIFEKIADVFAAIEMKNKSKTIKDVLNIFHSFELDIQRKGKILTWNQYNELIYYKAECVALFWLRFHLRCNNNIISKIAYHLGRIGQYVDDVCDFYKDLKIKQFNISKEEIYNLSIKNIFDINKEQMQKFCLGRRSIILKHCKEVLKIINELSSNKDKIIIYRFLEIATQLLRCNQFYPNAKHHFPYESFIKWITNTRDPIKYERFYHKIGSLFIYVPIGKIPIN